MRSRTLAGIGATALAAIGVLAVGSAPDAAAGKGGGGGGGTTVDTGTVYYTFNTGNGVAQQGKMNPDGTGKTTLAAGVFGSASRALHGGQRWFLQVREVGGTDTDGRSAKGELFAVNEAGTTAVQVTNDAAVLPDHYVTNAWCELSQWAGSSDDKVSYLGYTLAADAGGVLTPAEWGVWTVGVTWGTDGVPAAATVESTLVPNDLLPAPTRPNGPGWRQWLRYVWSPDGSELIYSDWYGDEMWRIGADGSGRTQILDGTTARTGVPHSWSTTGRIAYTRTDGAGGWFDLMAMNRDGSSATRILAVPRTGSMSDARWSPAGSYLVYSLDNQAVSASKRTQDVRRVASDGSGDVTLTGDVSGFAWPGDWR